MNNYKKISRILWVILLANILVAILKVVAGYIIFSASLIADGFHSVTDGTSNIIGLIGIKIASKPADEDHPYGHKKFETLSSLFIAGMLFVLASKIIFDAFHRFSNPVLPNVTLESLIILIITLCINIVVSTLEYRKGKELNSEILISDSIHTRSDIFISIGVLFTLVCIKLGVPPIIDSIASLIVAIFIIHASYEIYCSTSGVLVDKCVIDSDGVKEVVMKFEEVKDAHKIRSRGRNDEIYIDLHIMTNPEMSIEDSHNLIHDIEEKLRQEINENINLIVHLEPFSVNKSN